MTKVVQITLRDGLAFPDGFIAPSPYACILYCRVPTEWLDGDVLHEDRLEAIYEAMYGPTWREGNDDGSHYVVRSLKMQVLSAQEEESAPWRAVSNTNEVQYWFYDATNGAEVRSVNATEL